MLPEYVEQKEEKPSGYFDIPPHWVISSGWYSDNNLTMSDNMKIVNAQRQIIRNYADQSGVVIVGRTADQILQGYPNVLSVFFHADEDKRIQRCQELSSCDKDQAQKAIREMDHLRSDYYHTITGKKWGSENNYDMYLDLGELSSDEAIEQIIDRIHHTES